MMWLLQKSLKKLLLFGPHKCYVMFCFDPTMFIRFVLSSTGFFIVTFGPGHSVFKSVLYTVYRYQYHTFASHCPPLVSLLHLLFNVEGWGGGWPTVVEPVGQQAAEALPAQHQVGGVQLGLPRGTRTQAGLLLSLLFLARPPLGLLLLGVQHGQPGYQELLGEGGEGGGEEVVVAGVGQ